MGLVRQLSWATAEEKTGEVCPCRWEAPVPGQETAMSEGSGLMHLISVRWRPREQS